MATKGKPPISTKQRGTGRRGEVGISGTITIGAAGAVSSTSCEYAPNTGGTLAALSGQIVKNAAAGRYDIAFLRKFKNLRFTAGFLNKNGTTALGNTNANQVTNRLGAGITSGADATIQAFLASSGADTDAASGDVISFAFVGQEI